MLKHSQVFRVFLPLFFCLLFSQAVVSQPIGAALYRNGERLAHDIVPGNAGHHFYGELEGPAWENKYCAWRMYVDKADRCAIDIIGKKTDDYVLEKFSNQSLDVHKNHDWGGDILKVGSTTGFGHIRLLVDGEWKKPEIPETVDSVEITIADSSVETPRIEIVYHGWQITDDSKISVSWILTTAWEQHATQCTVNIDGAYDGQVIAAMRKGDDRTEIYEKELGLFATFGEQNNMREAAGSSSDTLLLAIKTDPLLFDTVLETGSNYGVVMNTDDNGTATYQFVSSWQKCVDPVYRKADWRESAFVQPSTSIKQPVVRYSLGRGDIGMNDRQYDCTGRRGYSIDLTKPAAPRVIISGSGEKRAILRRLAP